MLSWRGVQAGVPPPSHFSKVLAAFYKPGTVRGGLHKDIPAYPVPLVGNFRCLATECDSCRFSRPRPPCPPSQPAWEKGGLLGCTLGGPQVSPALLHVQGLGATGPHWESETSVRPVLRGAKAWHHKDGLHAPRKLQNQVGQCLAHLTGGVRPCAQLAIAQVCANLSRSRGPALAPPATPLLAQPSPLLHTRGPSRRVLCNPGDHVPSFPTCQQD